MVGVVAVVGEPDIVSVQVAAEDADIGRDVALGQCRLTAVEAAVHVHAAFQRVGFGACVERGRIAIGVGGRPVGAGLDPDLVAILRQCESGGHRLLGRGPGQAVAAVVRAGRGRIVDGAGGDRRVAGGGLVNADVHLSAHTWPGIAVDVRGRRACKRAAIDGRGTVTQVIIHDRVDIAVGDVDGDVADDLDRGGGVGHDQRLAPLTGVGVDEPADQGAGGEPGGAVGQGRAVIGCAVTGRAAPGAGDGARAGHDELRVAVETTGHAAERQDAAELQDAVHGVSVFVVVVALGIVREQAVAHRRVGGRVGLVDGMLRVVRENAVGQFWRRGVAEHAAAEGRRAVATQRAVGQRRRRCQGVDAAAVGRGAIAGERAVGQQREGGLAEQAAAVVGAIAAHRGVHQVRRGGLAEEAAGVGGVVIAHHTAGQCRGRGACARYATARRRRGVAADHAVGQGWGRAEVTVDTAAAEVRAVARYRAGGERWRGQPAEDSAAAVGRVVTGHHAVGERVRAVDAVAEDAGAAVVRVRAVGIAGGDRDAIEPDVGDLVCRHHVVGVVARVACCAEIAAEYSDIARDVALGQQRLVAGKAAVHGHAGLEREGLGAVVDRNAAATRVRGRQVAASLHPDLVSGDCGVHGRLQVAVGITP